MMPSIIKKCGRKPAIAVIISLFVTQTAIGADWSTSYYVGGGIGTATSDYICDYTDTEERDSARNRFATNVLDNRLEGVGFQNLIDQASITGGLTAADIEEINYDNFDDASRSCDDDDTAWKFFAGVNIGRHLGAEVGYADFGDTSADIIGSSVLGQIETVNGLDLDEEGTDADVNASISVDGEQDTFFIAALFRYPFHNNLELFGKFGIHAWDVDADAYATVQIDGPATYDDGGVSVDIPNDGATLSGPIEVVEIDDDGVDPFFGVGLNVTMDNGIGVRAEWERYLFDINLPDVAGDASFYTSNVDDEVDMFTLSVLYNF